jgi:hypothetical protein
MFSPAFTFQRGSTVIPRIGIIVIRGHNWKWQSRIPLVT